MKKEYIKPDVLVINISNESILDLSTNEEKLGWGDYDEEF